MQLMDAIVCLLAGRKDGFMIRYYLGLVMILLGLSGCSLSTSAPDVATAVVVVTEALETSEADSAVETAIANNGECWATNDSGAAINIYRDREMQQVYDQLQAGGRAFVTNIVHNFDQPEQIDYVTTRLAGGGVGYFSAEGLSFDASCVTLLELPPPPQECLATNISEAIMDVYSDPSRTEVVYQLAPFEAIVVTDALINAQDPMMVDWMIVGLSDGSQGYLVPNALSLSDACQAFIPVQ